MQVKHFYEPQTSSLTYVVHDGHVGVVIDPVRGYDPNSGRTSWKPVEDVADFINGLKLKVPYVIDTHAHADHITALPFFKERFGSKTVTGARIGAIQSTFRDVYNLGSDFQVDGSQFDVLIDEGEKLSAGSFKVEALHTPGHTAAHMSWKINDAVFVGDTLFMPDYGSARCDFPGGCAAQLYESIQRLYSFPDDTRLYMCHDYMPGGRQMAYQTTVRDQKRHNVQIDEQTTKEQYIAFRERKDADLATPVQLLPALQINIRAGELPEPESNGVSYLKIPVDLLGSPNQ